MQSKDDKTKKNEPCETRKNYKAKNGDDKTKNWALWDTKEL